MTARVGFNAGTPIGQLVAEAIDQVIEGKAKLNRAAETLYAMMYDPAGGSDTAAIESEFGLEAGRGQQFFDLINGAKLALGVFAMLVFAAFIEAYWSSRSDLPDALRFTVAGLLWFAILAWLGFGGRNAPAAEDPH